MSEAISAPEPPQQKQAPEKHKFFSLDQAVTVGHLLAAGAVFASAIIGGTAVVCRFYFDNATTQIKAGNDALQKSVDEKFARLKDDLTPDTVIGAQAPPDPFERLEDRLREVEGNQREMMGKFEEFEKRVFDALAHPRR